MEGDLVELSKQGNIQIGEQEELNLQQELEGYQGEEPGSLNSQNVSESHSLIQPQVIVIENGTAHQVEENSSSTENVITTGLLEYMKKVTVGKEILKAYDKCLKNKKLLPRNIRSKLVRLVIQRERDWLMKNIDSTQQLEKFVIKKERFTILADEIAYIFEGENPATYYNPFIQEGNLKVSAGGKLWHHYNYMKERMRQAELLATKHGKKPSYSISENDYSQIEWLSSHVEPWEELMEKWSDSFAARFQILQNDITIHEYLAKFPCFDLQEAKKLFLIDFAKIHPGIKYLDPKSWKIARVCLIEHLSNSTIKSVEDVALLRLLQSGDLSESKENFLIFYLLTYLIPSQRGIKRKKGEKENNDTRPHRLSLEERRSSFILRVQTANDVKLKLENYIEQLRLNSETFQPLIVAVGSVTNINALYVALNDKLYLVVNVFEAIKLALAIFLVWIVNILKIQGPFGYSCNGSSQVLSIDPT